MLLNLNNCSVLKPQGYSSLQSISETERYELKNILTFVFCWVEKLFSFGPLHIIQCVEKASALVLLINRWAVTYLRLKPLPVPPNQRHGSKAHSHLQQVQTKDYFSAIPTRAWQGAMLVFFSIKWRGKNWHQPAETIVSRAAGLGTSWFGWNLLGKALSLLQAKMAQQDMNLELDTTRLLKGPSKSFPTTLS